MFRLDTHGDRIAAINDAGQELRYTELIDFTEEFHSWIGKRTLIFIFCRNVFSALKAYVASLESGIVPLLLDAGMEEGLAKNLIETYQPEFIWAPNDVPWVNQYENAKSDGEYVLLKTGYDTAVLFDELGLLLNTSGSTGVAKLVRQSYRNIEANTESIVEYLKLDEEERPITTLPMQYTYGLSIINSHLYVGATILMTEFGIMQKEFWNFFKEAGATSFGGVPYTYEMLKKLRIFRMDLPTLKTMTQAGGKLTPELHKEFAEYAESQGKNFIVMYGQTEATARMAYLPAEKSLEKYGSMGIAIPGGKFSIIDANDNVITEPETVGELVYEGDNVTLGYAQTREELSLGDERFGKLITGDMAKFDADGFYYIVGRKKRFLKIYGNRVNLDECERLINANLGLEVACAGQDDNLCVYVTAEEDGKKCCEYLSKTTGIHHKAFTYKKIDAIPRNESGKIQYSELD